MTTKVSPAFNLEGDVTDADSAPGGLQDLGPGRAALGQLNRLLGARSEHLPDVFN